MNYLGFRFAAVAACLSMACGPEDPKTPDDSTQGGSSSTAGTGGSSSNTTAGTAGTVSSVGGSAPTTGGTAPSGGAPPVHQVGDCKDLGDVDEFENITPPGIEVAANVLVDPVNSGTIYLGTAKQGVYKSTNCGSDWTRVNTGAGADVINTGWQWSMGIDPVFPNVLYAGSLYGSDVSLQKSTNGGVDWISLFPKGGNVETTVDYNFLQELAMDPDKERNNHLVVSFHADCKGATGKQCLADTDDGGATWRIFKGPSNAWEENARPFILDKDTYLYVTWAGGAWYSPDRGGTWEKFAEGGNHQVYKTSEGIWHLGSAFGMMTSPDGRTWTKLERSPQGDGLWGDGTRLFAGLRNAGDDQQPYFVSPEVGAPDWQPFPSPPMGHGGVWFRYDADHNLMYSASAESGLWRFKTK